MDNPEHSHLPTPAPITQQDIERVLAQTCHFFDAGPGSSCMTYANPKNAAERLRNANAAKAGPIIDHLRKHRRRTHTSLNTAKHGDLAVDNEIRAGNGVDQAIVATAICRRDPQLAPKMQHLWLSLTGSVSVADAAFVLISDHHDLTSEPFQRQHGPDFYLGISELSRANPRGVWALDPFFRIGCPIGAYRDQLQERHEALRQAGVLFNRRPPAALPFNLVAPLQLEEIKPRVYWKLALALQRGQPVEYKRGCKF